MCPQTPELTGRILSWPSGTTAKTYYKTSDACELVYMGKSYEEYVPDFLQIWDNGYGDYVHVEVQQDGTIKDWNAERCMSWLKRNSDKFD